MLNKLIHWINRRDISTLASVIDKLDTIVEDTRLDEVARAELDRSVRLPLIRMFARKRGSQWDLKGE